MASIAKRSDGRWRARYRDAAGVEHSRHFTRQVEAQRWLDTVTTALTSGTYTDPRRSRITVSDWAARWLATKVDLKATTRRGYDGILRVHILTRWGAVKLADITHEQIAGWIAELRGSGLSASTVRQIHRVFSLVLALAVRDGRLARNPADGVPLPRATRGEQIFLTHDQLDALADAAGRERLVILFLGYTGVRYGEMAALRMRNLDLIKRRADRGGGRRRQWASRLRFA
jgi:integrase